MRARSVRVDGMQKKSVTGPARDDVEISRSAIHSHEFSAAMFSVESSYFSDGHGVGLSAGHGQHDDVGLPARTAKVADVRNLQQVTMALVQIHKASIGHPDCPG